MSKSSILNVTDVILPFEPRIVDLGRQTALSERYLLPALPELEAFFLAIRAHVDLALEPAQPVKLGKPYPLGQCLEISLAVMRLLEQPAVQLSGAAVAGHAAFTAFRKAGGALRLVWGDLRGEFFQNAFQLGTLYLDVSNDTVTPTKPKVEILPFEQARLIPVADYRHFARISSRYWKHRVYPNHVLPELAPYCPLIHLTPDGVLSIKDCTEYMVGMTRAGRFAPSEDVLSDEPMPAALFQYIVQALGDVKLKLPRTAEEGRVMALRACREYRSKRWYAAQHHGIKLVNATHELDLRLQRASTAQPYIAPSELPPTPVKSEPAMNAPGKITINGTEFSSANMSEEARRNFEMVRAIDNKLADLQRDMEIHQAARNAYIDALVKSLSAAPGHQ
ncbi:hypothetical protein ACEN9F_09270 [Duganella sp. CT11-25]|uniref:hypothetical protein n=1 Tax=unclassified Duganella TaxID=2636909 RepID=UPI0039AEB6E0